MALLNLVALQWKDWTQGILQRLGGFKLAIDFYLSSDNLYLRALAMCVDIAFSAKSGS